VPVHTIQLVPNNPEHMFVCLKGAQAFIMTIQGQLIKSFSSGKASGGEFTCGTISPHGRFIHVTKNGTCIIFFFYIGKWAYCVGEDGVLYIFDAVSGQLENVLQVADREIIGITHHPCRNLLVTITDNGELKLWKP
jgi:WD40 repeat-containing protein SMU1